MSIAKRDSFGGSDYHNYNPDGDCKSKLEHVVQMLQQVVYAVLLPIACVLMDSWYAAQKLITLVEELGKIYCCPLKTNWLVDDSGGVEPYKRLEHPQWTALEQQLEKAD